MQHGPAMQRTSGLGFGRTLYGIGQAVLAAGGVVFACVWDPETMLAVHAKTETLEGLRAPCRASSISRATNLRDTFKEAKAELLKGC